MNSIWVFNGAMARFPSAVFSSSSKASEWIEKNKLTGVLTKYPLDQGVYDWAVQNNFFSPNNDKHTTPAFIGGFTCSSLEHIHFENGGRD